MAAQGNAGGKAEKMKEIPVLFNGAMVRAILDDRKTQTRRIVKPQPERWLAGWRWGGHHRGSKYGAFAATPELAFIERMIDGGYCPHAPGDRLWVRETFISLPACAETGRRAHAIYHADGGYSDGYKWLPSIHMPRWAARLFLDVLDVRIERLQDISEEDARAEGVEQCGGFMTTWGCWMNYGKSGPSCKTARESFYTLWISVYGAESWAANPWVWVTKFKRVT
jgi:hypothetical protein